jgi:hypothetical protein
MDARTFISLLKDPSLLHTMPAEELSDAAAKYPYNAALQMLLAKKYQLSGDGDHETALARAALVSPDRRALYEFIGMNHVPPAEFVTAKTNGTTAANEDIAALPRARKLVPQKLIDALPKELHFEEQPQPAPRVQPEEMHLPIEPVHATPETVQVESGFEPLKEKPAEIKPEPAAEKPVETEVATELVQAVQEEVKPAEAIVPQSQPEPAKPLDIKADKLSFNNWLKKLQDGSVEDAKELEGIIQTGSYEAQLVKESKIEEPIKPVKKPKPQESPLEQKVEQMAKDSVKSGDDLITETLAKIYEIQKKYAKAIDAYEKLSVKFPEKAPQYRVIIERLKGKV